MTDTYSEQARELVSNWEPMPEHIAVLVGRLLVGDGTGSAS